VIAQKKRLPSTEQHSYGVLIRLRRVGKDGNLFNVFKFRTMYAYSEYLQTYIYENNDLDVGGKFRDDYRVTEWGRFLRKTWLDELPMIINLLKGQMKLVGVRPLSQQYFNLYTKDLQELRIKTKPGLIPPFYVDMPETLDEIQENEKRYLIAYLEHPLRTDWNYFWRIMGNILFRGKRSK
jgi:lipopolysaccharide/colanic/teichoic acid biosynthesis glycosyltransferase